MMGFYGEAGIVDNHLDRECGLAILAESNLSLLRQGDSFLYMVRNLVFKFFEIDIFCPF